MPGLALLLHSARNALSINVFCLDLNYKLLEVNNICPIYFVKFQRAFQKSSLMGELGS